MSAPEIRRTYHEFTPEEHQQWVERRKLVEKDLPDLERQARQALAEARATAMQEPTISGQLRRAIADSGYDHRQLGELRVYPNTSIALNRDFAVGCAFSSCNGEPGHAVSIDAS